MQEKKSLSAAVFQMWMLKSTISVLVAESQMTSSADCPRPNLSQSHSAMALLDFGLTEPLVELFPHASLLIQMWVMMVRL